MLRLDFQPAGPPFNLGTGGGVIGSGNKAIDVAVSASAC
jgi:hypothetical protein